MVSATPRRYLYLSFFLQFEQVSAFVVVCMYDAGTRIDLVGWLGKDAQQVHKCDECVWASTNVVLHHSLFYYSHIVGDPVLCYRPYGRADSDTEQPILVPAIRSWLWISWRIPCLAFCGDRFVPGL